MSKDIVPFWEKAYQNQEITAFSSKPNATVKEFEHLLDKQARILDVGCGEGQNACYLAKQGFCNVDAFDLSEHGIAKLRQRCNVDEMEVHAFIADLRTYAFAQNYDLVMSFGTLVWKEFIHRAKRNTNKGGIHIMQIFTDTIPASADIASFAVGLAKDGEIKELYQDWEILKYQSYTFEDEHPGVPKHLHASSKIVARKTL